MVSWYGAQILTHVDTADLLLFDCFVVVGLEVPRIKLPKDRGMTCSISSYLVTEVNRPFVGRDPVRFSGCPARGDPMWQWEVP